MSNRVAVLLDGGFVQKRLRSISGRKTLAAELHLAVCDLAGPSFPVFHQAGTCLSQGWALIRAGEEGVKRI